MHVIVMGQNVQHLHAIAKIISMFNPGRNSWIFYCAGNTISWYLADLMLSFY